jgi:hypothetical protein
MYVFLEREEEKKDGKYLLNSVAMLVAYWLYEVKKSSKKGTFIFLPSFIGGVTERREKEEIRRC